MMISYAQNAEDVLLQRFFAGDLPQLYVDVGAGDPVHDSVTKHFYDHGWHGLNLEPQPDKWRALRLSRPRDVSLQCALGAVASATTLYIVRTRSNQIDICGLSTLDAALAQGYREQGFEVTERPTPIYTLSQVLANHNIEEIGFLKIDCEGYELEVLRGWDHVRYRPRVIVVESTAPLSPQRNDFVLRAYLETRAYRFAHFDGLNGYYVRGEDEDRLGRLAAPVSVFDHFETARYADLCRRLADAELRMRNAESELAALRREINPAHCIPPSTGRFSVDVRSLDQIDFPASQFHSRVGRQCEDGLAVPAGAHDSHVVFGPYRGLAPGRYRLQFRFLNDVLPANQVVLDAAYAPQGPVLAKLRCTKGRDAVLEFDHRQTHRLLEFRVFVPADAVPVDSVLRGVQLNPLNRLSVISADPQVAIAGIRAA